jgi:hypothetical protein
MMDDRPVADDGGAPALPADPWSRFDGWSRALFAVLGLLWVFAFLLAVMPSIRVGVPVGALVVVSTAVSIACLTVVVVAIGRGLTWARPAAVATLWAILAAGVVGAVADLLVPRLTIPLGAILALVLLRARPADRQAATGRDRRLALGLGAAYLASGVLIGAATMLVNPPAVLTAGRDDLQLGVTTNCGEPGFVQGKTEVEVTVTWAWAKRDAWPAVEDVFEVAWGRLSPLGQDGVRGPFAGDLVREPEGAAARLLDAPGTRREPPYMRFGLSGASAAAAGGSATFLFDWSNARIVDVEDFVLTWAHGDRWSVQALARCEWEAEARLEVVRVP